MKTILSISFKNIFFHKFQFFSWNAIKNKILNIFEKKMQILFFTSGFDFHEKYLLNIVIGVNTIWYFYVRGALSLKPHLLFFWRGGGGWGGGRLCPRHPRMGVPPPGPGHFRLFPQAWCFSWGTGWRFSISGLHFPSKKLEKCTAIYFWRFQKNKTFLFVKKVIVRYRRFSFVFEVFFLQKQNSVFKNAVKKIEIFEKSKKSTKSEWKM